MMTPRVVLTDQQILMLILVSQSYAFTAVKDPGFGEAHSLGEEWSKAVQQYAVAVEDNSAEVPAHRARVMRLSQKVFESVDWATVGGFANTIWLKDQLRDLGEHGRDDSEKNL